MLSTDRAKRQRNFNIQTDAYQQTDTEDQLLLIINKLFQNKKNRHIMMKRLATIPKLLKIVIKNNNTILFAYFFWNN